MATDTDSFGVLLRRLRRALDLTQEQLADDVSCSRYTIRKIESDERRPSRHLAQRLLQRLSLDGAERDAFLAAARGLRAGPSQPVQNDTEPLATEPGTPPAPDTATPLLAGRQHELAQLARLLAEAQAGCGHVVVMEGEPGIGKSRLLAELVALAQRHGACVLASRCYEIERSVPYQPVIELAGQAVERLRGTSGALAAADLAEIAALVPEVGSTVAAAPPSDMPEARQARLFRALRNLLDAAAGSATTVLVVDDLQWADETSAQFLHWLARQAAPRRLLLLYSTRDENLGIDDRLAALVHSLLREPHALHLPLARLDLAATQTLLGAHADAALAERLHRETEGNPFFLVSLLQGLHEGSAIGGAAAALPLPQALRSALRERLARVPPEARSTLDAAAVLGRHFELHHLADLTGDAEAQVLAALDALTSRRLLLENDEGRFDFVHDKLREVAYLEIGASRRVLLHRAAAQALERAGMDGGELAEHCERGRLWPQAAQNMLRAGEQSLRWFATRDALQWFDRAIALAREHPEAAAVPLQELHARRGSARALAGQIDGAVDDLRLVIDTLRQDGNDPAGLRDALIELGMAYRRADSYAPAIAALDEALAVSRAMGDERHAADTLYHLGTVAWSNGNNRGAIAFHAQAVEISERLGLTDLVAVQAWHGRGEAHLNHLEPAQAIASFERSIALARGIGDKSYACENAMMVGYACTGFLGLADYARAEAAFTAAQTIAREADLRWHLVPTLLGLAHVRACNGHYGEAWTTMARTLQGLAGAGHPRYELMARDLMAGILLDLGLASRAAELLQGAQRLSADRDLRFWRPRITASLAIALSRAGQPGPTAALESALAESLASDEAMYAARCRLALAEVALRQGDLPACLQHAQALAQAAEHGGLRELALSARCLQAAVLTRQGQRPQAVKAFAAVHQEALQMGRLRLVLDTALALGQLGQDTAAATATLATQIRASLHGSALENAPVDLQYSL